MDNDRKTERESVSEHLIWFHWNCCRIC